MKKVSLLILTAIILCSISCQNQRNKNSSFHEFDLAKLLKRPMEMVMSDIVSEISYIPLETSQEALLSRVHIIIQAKESLIISNRNGPVKLFSNKGDYIRDIGSKGKGPGEYVNIGGVFWDKVSEEVIIQDISLKSLHYYSLEGNYLRSFRIPYQSHFVYPLNDGNFLSANIYPVKMDSVYGKNFIFDTMGMAKPFWSSEVELDQTVSKFAIPPTYCRVGNMDLFFPERSDSVFIIKNGKVSPFACFNLENRMLPDEAYLNSTTDSEMRRFIHNFFPMEISKSEFLMLFRMNREYFIAFCNINNDKVKLAKLGKNGLKNDIDGGMPLYPVFLTSEGYLFRAVSPIEIIAAVENGTIDKPSNEFKEMVSKLDEEDNHVIIKMKLK